MARTIFVHVGPTKTGTSAIQSIMSRHDDSILVYPKIGMTKLGSHHDLVYSLCGKHGRRKGPNAGTVPANAQELLQGIADCWRKSRLDLMFSSEVLAGPVSGRKVRRNISSFVDALTDSLRGENFVVEILFVCRDHFERAASTYSQRLKGTYSNEKRSPDEFLTRYAEGLLYAPLGRELARTGFKVTALNYHPSQSFVPRFLAHVGFEVRQVPHTKPTNVSLSTKAMIAKLAANRMLPEEADRITFSKALRRKSGYRAASRFIFGQGAAAEVENRFCADRLCLEREFGVRIPDPQAETRENVFFLDATELHDIAGAAEHLGTRGQVVVDAASQFLRTS